MQAKYTYDAVGRLVRENNQAFGESYFYTYDNNGNILTKEKCAFTTSIHTPGTGMVTSYTYDKDRMTAFGGQSCVYDSVGNPTTYRGKTAVWARGRKLVSYNGATFEYDAQGRRIKKNSIEYIYDSQGRLLKQSNGLEFFYDTTGLLGFIYAGNKYVYRKDIQGNIIAILDSAGTLVVQYEYDAWGNQKVLNANGVEITSPTHIGNLNPFRYRSYYFDTETGFYFLKTRYYDPEVGRFINIDSLRYVVPETINGLNLFAYCGNNPVMGYDPEGTFAFWIVIVIQVVWASVIMAGIATAAAVEESKEAVDKYDDIGYPDDMDVPSYSGHLDGNAEGNGVAYYNVPIDDTMSDKKIMEYVNYLYDQDEIRQYWTKEELYREIKYHYRGSLLPFPEFIKSHFTDGAGVEVVQSFKTRFYKFLGDLLILFD